MRWEYKVIHVNANGNEPMTTLSDPTIDSSKLGVSPEFIQKEFPHHYKDKRAPKHPAQQLEEFLTRIGSERWELVEFGQVADLLMFIFKRPITAGDFEQSINLSYQLDFRLKSFLRNGAPRYYKSTIEKSGPIPNKVNDSPSPPIHPKEPRQD